MNPLALLVGSLLAVPLSAQSVTAPADHLGRPVGADFELADWEEVSGYFRRLADESPRVLLEDIGDTTEGRDFLLATISSEANLGELDALRQAARRIADPRGLAEQEREELLARAKPILFVSIAMHSTETAAPQFGMEFAHRLATSDEEPYASAREEMVVLLAPCLNPDGLDHVVSWYRETVGTPYESSDLLKLYQYYAGHDNNRDWFSLSQNETRIVTRQLYSRWFPQVYWDVHQQGQSRERMFVPPFRDPLNPNLDAGIIAGIDQLGTRALFDMTREGLTGVSTGVTYDMWWNGGNRNVPVRHNIIGLLTEAASVDIASPIFLAPDELRAPRGLEDYAPSNRFPAPWPGGWWRLRDIIDYEHAFGRSLLASIAREPRLWLENSLGAAERAIEKGRTDAPRAWVVPANDQDRGAARRLVQTLLIGGVEVHLAREEFVADGRTWPAGSIVIRRDQPYGQHVKDLFEVQRYPNGQPPYDVTGWTLPLLFGLRRAELVEEPVVPLVPVRSGSDAVSLFRSEVQPPRAPVYESDAWREVFRRLIAEEPVVWDRTERGPTLLFGGRMMAVGQAPRELRLPRIGVYAPWRSSMDEGWLRWVFDSFGVPYVRVRNEMIRPGALDEFLDVLVIPSISGRTLDEGRPEGSVPAAFTRGLGAEGAAAIDDFVRRGGKLIAIDRSADWAIDLFDLPLRNVARGELAGGFSCPGSVLRAVPEPSVLTDGLPPSVAVFFARSAAWELDEPDEPDEGDDEAGRSALHVLMRYAPRRVLLSGYVKEPERIADRASWVLAEHEAGRVHLFGFRPQYRGWSQATFQLLFRALLLDS